MTISTNRVINKFIFTYLLINYLFGINYLILTPSSLNDAAEQIQEIYSLDPTKNYYLDTQIKIIDDMSHEEINNYVKSMIIDNLDLKYLLILGDENNFPPFTKAVPCGSNNSYVDYPTDDYYSSLNSDDDFLNSEIESNPRLATGRIPASNLNEAIIFISKIKNYIENDIYGSWKNKVLLVSDDENKNDSSIENEIRHTENSDIIYKKISDLTFSKTLYGPTYESTYYGGERRLPDLTDDIISNLNSGIALINYIGHGDPETWSAEHIINKDRDINLINIPGGKLPIWVAGTCSFGRYDEVESMAEALLFDTHGAISIIGAARSISESVNKKFSEQLFEALKINIENEDEDEILRLGDIFLDAKNSLSDSYYSFNCNGGYLFNILGDPAIPLPFSKKKEINSLLIESPTQIETLNTYEFPNSEEFSYIEILDEEEEIILLFNQDEDTLKFTPSPNIIYHSEYLGTTCFTASEDMGEKSVFIKYYSENENLDNYIAKSELIEILNNNNDISDIEGPKILFLLDGTKLESNSYISEISDITIEITDTIGINTSSNIGHGTRYGFNDINQLDYSIDSQDFIFLENCNGISFNITLPENLTENTKLFIESWDNANNKSLDSLSMNIISELSSNNVFNIYNFPNPFSDRTFFTYQIKDYSSSDITTELHIYAQSGVLINEIYKVSSALNNFIAIEWDGKNSRGDSLPNGTYLYTLKIQYDNNSYEKIGVLSIIR